VGFERTFRNKVLRVLFKYGWDDFYANNNLNVGDTCFFSVIREATYSNDNEAKLKVEVCKTNGGWRRLTRRKS
jgi:hypothetical protein